MKDVFCFGGVKFVIHADFSIPWIPEELAFRLEEEEKTGCPEKHYYISQYQSEPPLPDKPLLYQGKNVRVYQGDEGEIRIHYLFGTEISMYCEEKKDGCYIQVLPAIAKDAQMYLFGLMLEKVLLEQDGLILHCAYLKTEHGAVLFTAPSETGKSTQADLWVKYREKCRVINGDRAILRKLDGKWNACGLPLCGSSKISENLSIPIRAIVYLRQAPEDKAVKLMPVAAYSKVMSEVSINFWNQTCADRATSLLADVMKKVPVYLLDCTPTKQAVEELNRIFQEDHV